MRMIREVVQRTLNKAGFELRHSDLVNWAARRKALIDARGLKLVVDVGANAGQYARSLRRSGYCGRIVSFEPIPDAFKRLSDTMSGDSGWQGYQVAMGKADGSAILYVSHDSVSSSLLKPSDILVSAAARTATAESIEVKIRSLDSMVAEANLDGPLHLKIDTQGFEEEVLAGAKQLLERAAMVEIEMALVGLYEGGSRLETLLPELVREGFQIVGISEGFVDPKTHQTLDADVLMTR